MTTGYVVPGYWTSGYATGDNTEQFIWNKHRYSTEYADSGFRMELGRSYQFSSEPDGPDQRIFTLYFETMKYFEAPSGGVDKTVSPSINMALLEDFYIQNRMWRTFVYNHPVYGPLNVKFNKPLRIPKGIFGGGGALEPFDIELIEIP